MKKLFFTGLLFGSLIANAQTVKVVSAYTYYNKFTKDNDEDKLQLALENIEAAILDPKTSLEAKTWKYRADIISAISQAKKIEIRTLIKPEEVLTKLKESYAKVFELDKKDAYTSEIKGQIAVMENMTINNAVKLYNENKFKEAYGLFMGAATMGDLVGVTDSLAIFNGAVAAEKAGMVDEAIKAYQKSVDIKYGDSKTYLSIIRLYQGKKDHANALATVKKARAEYPNEQAFVIEELNFYLKDNKYAEAEAALKVAVDKDPNNEQLYFAAGSVYDKLGRYDDAAKSYKKALEVKPGYFDAAYNLGAMYFNEGVELNNKANDLDYNKQKAKIDELNKKADAKFKEALPLLEQALKSAPEDIGTIQSLKQLYLRLEMTEKYNEMKKKLGE